MWESSIAYHRSDGCGEVHLRSKSAVLKVVAAAESRKRLLTGRDSDRIELVMGSQRGWSKSS